jgi:hypothetical protein
VEALLLHQVSLRCMQACMVQLLMLQVFFEP